VPEPLPDYRVTARNTAAGSDNRVHDPDEARRRGFRGAVVPGVTVYAYLTRPLVAALGEAWLRRGTAHVRFRRPVIDGEEVTVRGAITAREPAGLTAEVRAQTAAEGECATLVATLPAGTPTPVNAALYVERPLPGERPPASREHLASLPALGSPTTRLDPEQAEAWLAAVGDPLPLYRGPSAWIHPALYLVQANRALDRNVRLDFWVHVESRVRHLGGARVGQELRTLGRIRSLFERKGREFVEVDLVVLADRTPAAHVLHTAIYRLP
jgi:acyl dehydratase